MTDTDDPDDFPDALDLEVFDRLQSIYERLDPPPQMLDELALFALAPALVDHELARLVDDASSDLVVRDSAGTRTLEFNAGESTILLTVVQLRDDLVRLDGWLSPPIVVDIDVRVFGEPLRSLTVTTDVTGRFVVPSLRGGRLQLVVRTDPPLVTVATQL